MSTPILATKLYLPAPRPQVVHRPRLIERVHQGLPRKLTLISAPAGFGKTTLVSEWIASSETPWAQRAAWLSLDQGDNDPSRFLTYLIAALQTMAAQLGQGSLRLLQSAPPAPTESILTALLNEIAAYPDPFVLVLDDYHRIDAKAVDLALTFLIEHMPPQMHLVIATREDPQLPLARLRARGQLVELRVADLRFTPDEAARFLRQVMGLELAAHEIAALETRTEGWIAGLQLAALSMQGRSDAAGFIKSFTGSHHFVLDYLAEEVVQQQPESVQNFLLGTSILDRLCGPLCDALLHAPAGSGQAMLEMVERANLFIVPLDNERRWYRYHHLFADLLQQRLQQSAAASTKDSATEPDIDTDRRQISIRELSLADLHSRASRWFEENRLNAEAFHHAVAAQDFVRAADLAERAYPVMDGAFQSAIWLDWVQTLPEALIRVRPVLSVAYAWALLNAGELDASEARLRDAEQWLHGTTETSAKQQAPVDLMVVADEEEFRLLPASIATARAYRTQTLGDLASTVRYAQQALDLLSEGDHARRGVAASLLGLAYWANGELEAAQRALVDGMENFQMAGHLTFALTGTFGRADIRVAQARLHEALHIYEHALQLGAAQDEATLPVTADHYLGLALLQHELGDAETAAHYMRKSKELGEQTATQNWPYRWSHAQARMQESQGDLEGALLWLEEDERLHIRNPMPNVRPVAALKARIWVKQDRLADALGWVRAQGLSADDELSYVREFDYCTLARVLIATYARDHSDQTISEALTLLERLRKAAQNGQRMGSVIEILVLEALAHHAQSDSAAALSSLEEALRLAEPEGYVRLFVDEGAPMAHLLAQLQAQLAAQRLPAAHATMTHYIARLLAVWEDEQPQGADKAYAPPTQPQNGSLIQPLIEPLIEPLSQREVEILQLIAQGHSNREICEQLFLALSTVKGHNRNIFGKLGVQRRTEAVARARELGLL